MERALNPGSVRWEAGEGLAARLRMWIHRLAAPCVASDAPLLLEARLGLGPKKSLVLVNCCGKRVLLAVSGDAVQPVMEMSAIVRSARKRQSKGREDRP